VPSDQGWRRAKDVALRCAVQPIPGDGRAQRIPTEPFEPRPLVGVHPDGGLKVEPVLARLTTAGSRGLVGLNSLAALAHPRTRARPHGHRPLHGGRRDPRQDRRLLSPHVRRAHAVAAVRQFVPREPTHDARHDGREHLGHIQILQRGGRPERDAPARTRKHAVHDQGRHRCVQIQRAPEPLDDSHPSTLLGMALSIVEGPDSRSAGTRETPASAEASAWHAVAIRAKAACSTAAFRSIGMRAPAASG